MDQRAGRPEQSLAPNQPIFGATAPWRQCWPRGSRPPETASLGMATDTRSATEPCRRPRWAAWKEAAAALRQEKGKSRHGGLVLFHRASPQAWARASTRQTRQTEVTSTNSRCRSSFASSGSICRLLFPDTQVQAPKLPRPRMVLTASRYIKTKVTLALIVHPSPSHFSKQAPGPLADRKLPSLVQQEKTSTKSHGQEPVFDRHLRRRQDGLQRGDVQPKEGHDQGKGNGRKEVVVLGELVEDGRVLEDGQASGADAQQVEPLPRRAPVSDRLENSWGPTVALT